MMAFHHGIKLRKDAASRSHKLRRKGLMHTLEAVLAFMIILSYSGDIIDMTIYDNGWDLSALSQESREIMSVLCSLGYDKHLIGNDYNAFSSAVMYIAGTQQMGVAISTDNLVVPLLRVGVVTSDRDTYLYYSRNMLQNIFGEYETISMNERDILLEIRNTTWDADWKTFDIILIPIVGSEADRIGNLTVMDSYTSKLFNFLLLGKGIVQVSNLSNSSFLNFSVQEDVFGLLWNNTALLPPSSGVSSFTELRAIDPGNSIHKYYYIAPLKLGTDSFSMINLSVDGSWNMTTGIVTVYLGNTNYTLGTANCTINNPTICQGDDMTTLNFLNTLNSTNGIYGYNILSLKHQQYGVLVLNSTGSDYDVVYIDVNQDENFTNDGYFSGLVKGDTITLDGNNYTISDINSRGLFVDFAMKRPHYFATLNTDNEVYSAHGFNNAFVNGSPYIVLETNFSTSYGAKLPVSIVNYGEFTGRTAWVTENFISRDEWHFLRSLVLWVSSRKHVVSQMSPNVKDVVTTDLVLFANKDVSQPYILKWKVWNYE